MFETVPLAPPDSILGLTEAFRKDPNPEKINLGIGVFCDESGKTPILETVREAEKRLLVTDTSKGYLPIEGSAQYGQLVLGLLLGEDHPAVAGGRCSCAHTPGGTGALRVAADFIKKLLPGAKVWFSNPTWPNHPQILQAAGVESGTYPYFDAAANALALEPMLAALEQLPAGDVVLLHACCHNPSGIDPTPDEWSRIGEVLARRNLLPLIDYAYQGFGRGLREDSQGILALLEHCPEAIIASSYSKNFGLYKERVGALTVISRDAETATRVHSQVKSVVRANYSNPPSHGGAVVATILADPELRARWEQEVAAMRERIHGMRSEFVTKLEGLGVKNDFSFIARQLGMFSFSGLTPAQVERLKTEFGIYIVGNGRINVAGMTPGNLDRLCSSIQAVL